MREDRHVPLVRTADRSDGGGVRGLVGLRIARGDRGLAEHVVGIAVARCVCGAAAVERFVDRATHHELLGHQLHGLPQRNADDGLAGTGDDAFVPGDRIA